MDGDAVQTSARHDEHDDDDRVPPSRQLSPEEWQAVIERRLRSGSLRMASMERGLQENTALTAEIKELLDMARAGLRILGYLGAVARWATPIVGLCGVLYGWYQSVRHGSAPPAAK